MRVRHSELTRPEVASDRELDQSLSRRQSRSASAVRYREALEAVFFGRRHTVAMKLRAVMSRGKLRKAPHPSSWRPSPRRGSSSVGLTFTVDPADVDEEHVATEPQQPSLGRLKAGHVARRYADAVVIGADRRWSTARLGQPRMPRTPGACSACCRAGRTGDHGRRRGGRCHGPHGIDAERTLVTFVPSEGRSLATSLQGNRWTRPALMPSRAAEHCSSPGSRDVTPMWWDCRSSC